MIGLWIVAVVALVIAITALIVAGIGYDSDDGPASTNPTQLTTKGDILTFGTEAQRLRVGQQNSALVADVSQTTGLRYSSSIVTESRDVTSNVNPAVTGAEYNCDVTLAGIEITLPTAPLIGSQIRINHMVGPVRSQPITVIATSANLIYESAQLNSFSPFSAGKSSFVIRTFFASHTFIYVGVDVWLAKHRGVGLMRQSPLATGEMADEINSMYVSNIAMGSTIMLPAATGTAGRILIVGTGNSGNVEAQAGENINGSTAAVPLAAWAQMHCVDTGLSAWSCQV